MRNCDDFAECHDYNAAEHYDALFAGHYRDQDPLIRLTSAQDYVALMGQGTIVDRSGDLLGASDRSIALLRHIMRREVEAVASGSPAKQCRPTDGSATLFRPVDATAQRPE